MKTAILVTLIVLHVWSILSTVATVGKPRQPVTPPQGAIIVLFQGAILSGLLYLLLEG